MGNGLINKKFIIWGIFLRLEVKKGHYTLREARRELIIFFIHHYMLQDLNIDISFDVRNDMKFQDGLGVVGNLIERTRIS